MSDRLKEIRRRVAIVKIANEVKHFPLAKYPRCSWDRQTTTILLDDVDFLLVEIMVLQLALKLSCDAEARMADGAPIMSVWTPQDYIDKAKEELAQESEDAD